MNSLIISGTDNGGRSDYASSVEEALELMDDHNIDFSCSLPLHYLLADRMGSSALVEYVAGEMRILRSEQPW